MVLTVHVGPIALDPVSFTRFAGGNGAMPGWLGGSGRRPAAPHRGDPRRPD
jgi:hypothetical protein